MLKHIKNWLEHNSYTIALSFTVLVIILSLASFSSVGVKIMKVKNSDKLGHIIAYFVLTLSWFHATKHQLNLPKQKFFLIAALVLFGIILEALQEGLTTHRKADLYDVFANSVGIFLAAILFKRVKTTFNSMLK